jgi:hypothetical protein
MPNLGNYSKTVAAVVVGALGWAAVVIASPAHAITAPEWLVGATALATALGVYTVKNG